MAAKNREKIKLMIVIGLAVIFVITAYFRFLAPKASSDVTEPAAALAEPQTTIPKIEIKKRQNDPEPASSSVSGRRFVQRDIFAPLNIPVAQKIKKKSDAQKPADKPSPEPASQPALSLGGTIVGGQQGYRVTTVSATLATETIEFIDTGTILDITPHIVDDTHVMLDVAPSIDAARVETDGIPVVKTTSVKTSLLAKNGQTVFIGGLIQDTKLKQRDIVPFFGDIPVVGVLFGRTSRGIGKSELVVLITPYIVGTELKAIDLNSKQKATEVKEMLDQEPPPTKKMLKELFLLENGSR